MHAIGSVDSALGEITAVTVGVSETVAVELYVFALPATGTAQIELMLTYVHS